jgi:hypothetical protein
VAATTTYLYNYGYTITNLSTHARWSPEIWKTGRYINMDGFCQYAALRLRSRKACATCQTPVTVMYVIYYNQLLTFQQFFKVEQIQVSDGTCIDLTNYTFHTVYCPVARVLVQTYPKRRLQKRRSKVENY